MKEKIDLTEILSGSYNETVNVIGDMSIILKPPTLRQREEAILAGRQEIAKKNESLREFGGDEKSALTSGDELVVLEKLMSSCVITSMSMNGKPQEFKSQKEVLSWLDELPMHVSDHVMAACMDFLQYFSQKTKEAVNDDPFELKTSEEPPS
jgi:hypothetical protein